MLELNRDLLQQILKRVNVRDLIRCKNVCKSWETVISNSLFVKVHMNHSYHIDCNNNDLDRRIVMARPPYLYGSRRYEFDDRFFDYRDFHVLGSSNGLVCISRFAYHNNQIIVANPATREVKKIIEPQIPNIRQSCWGFGYDSSTDDYKVMLGFTEGDGLTCFQVLSLKSNVWKLTGDVNYSFVSRIGILCNGALHWVMNGPSSENNKKVILSFCLSEEEFKEIPQPDNVGYESGTAHLPTMRLGTLEECLCVFHYDNNLWMMTEYNVKQSWGIVGKDFERKLVVHCLKELKHYIPHKRSLCHDKLLLRTREFIGAPVYVESLVSPHINGKPKRKRQTNNIKKSCKLIKGDPSIPGPSGKV